MQGLGKTERGEQGRDIDLTSLRSTMPASGPLQGGSASNLNMNLYATKKTAAEGMLDIALFLANVTHMKTVIEQGAGFRYYIAVLTLISFSLALQIVAGVLIIIIARRDITDEANQKRLDSMNNITTIIIFFIFITNIFITVFGMERTGLFPRMHF
ncbi:ninjurin-2-like isoform X4 [Myripristis murdjan]|uniref:ninjurin-2-like isoform X4 n=1 Tax=Myripristis murdjan TaxID=586833 RepID=UPI001175FE4B|nr:ninjurin-2-like isoform X4 [Myripristis murdjan]XP_029902374.1 ninjurin-2-like isoform X4 [Myripristis murdjan]